MSSCDKKLKDREEEFYESSLGYNIGIGELSGAVAMLLKEELICCVVERRLARYSYGCN